MQEVNRNPVHRLEHRAIIEIWGYGDMGIWGLVIVPKPIKQQPLTQGQEFIGLFAGLFGGYIAAEATLAAYNHSLHWLTAAAAAGLGYYGIRAWYMYRRWSNLRKIPQEEIGRVQ